MKKLILYLLVGVVIGSLTACSDSDYTSRLKELIIEDMTFDDGQSSQSLTFRHEDLSNYECKSSEEWCVISLDVANSRLVVSVKANETYDSRTATIVLADKIDGTLRAFNVTQKRKPGLFIGETSFEVPMEGSSINVNMESNVKYEIQIPSEYDWIHLAESSSTRGLEKSSFTLLVDENKSYHERTAIITVINKDENLSGKVTVHQPFDLVFNADSTSFNMDMDGGIITINLESNISYNVNIPKECDWITRTSSAKTRATKSEAILLKVAENKSYHDRDAVITIGNEEAGAEINVIVHQSFVAVFNADQKTFEIPMEGGTVNVNMESNVSYEVSIPKDCDWVTLPSAGRTRATTTSTVKLNVAENKSYKDRTVVVTISNKEAGVSVPITIHQPFNTIFKADKTYFEVDMAGGTVTVNMESNISYDVKIPEDCDWITLPASSRKASVTKAEASASAVNLRVKENTSFKDRDAVVTIYNKEAGAEIRISVHQPFNTVFKADKTDFEVDMAGGTVTVNMESNISYDVRIPSDCDWISLPVTSRRSGATRAATSTSQVVLRVKENTSFKDRDAVVTIYNKEAGAEIKITVHQPYNPILKADKTAFDVDMTGGTVTVNIESNISYDVSIPSDCDWITLPANARKSGTTRGSSTSAVVLRVKENTSFKDRDAVVTISNNAAKASVKIYIHQPFNASFKVDKTEFEVPIGGGSVSVNVESNITFDVRIPSDCDWIKVSDGARTRGTKTSVVTFLVSANTSERDRSATITIGNSSAGVSANIIISQKFNLIFVVDEAPQQIDELGGTVGISIAANVNVTVQPQVTWLKDGGKTAVGNGYWTQKITVSPLTTKVAQRKGKVKFLYAPANTSFYVEVIQNRLLYISESEVNLAVGQSQALTLNNSEAMEVHWSSSNARVATVSSSGTVTAVAAGEAVITVKSADGKYSDKVTVIVNTQ